MMSVFRTGGEAEETGFSASLKNGGVVLYRMGAESGFREFCLDERDSDLLLNLRPEFLSVTA